MGIGIYIGNMVGRSSGSSWTPKYYVSNTGNDANTGLAPLAAWQTIAKVNSMTFVPGDKIGFHKDHIWKEQLTVPSAGSSDKPIEFGAYGSGALLPIIDGSEIIDTWSVESPNNYNYGDTVTNWAFGTWGANYIYCYPITIDKDGTITSIKKWNGATSAVNTKIGIYTDNAGSPGTLVTNGVTDELSLTANSVNTYTFTVNPVVTAGNYWLGYLGAASSYAANAGAVTCHYQSRTYASGFPSTFTSGGTAAQVIEFYAVLNVSISGGYSKAMATRPYGVWFDETVGQHKSSTTNTSDKDWYWASNVLHIISTSDPAARVITATQRNFGIRNADKANITVKNIHVKKVWQEGIVAGNSSAVNMKVSDCEIERCGGGVMTAADYTNVTKCNIHDLEHMIVDNHDAGDYGATGVMIKANYCTVTYSQFTNCRSVSQQFGHDGCFIEFYVPGSTSTGNSFHNNTATNCNAYTEVNGGITNTTYYRNIWKNIVGSSILIFHNTGATYTNFGFYNNTFYDNYSVLKVLTSQFDAAPTNGGLIWRNNIFYTVGSMTRLINRTDFVHDHNYYFGGNDDISLDATEKIDDPLFVDVTNGDYRLSTNSPCIGAGVDVGLGETNPNIGAYEKQ